MRNVMAAVLLVGAWGIAGCASKATPEDINKMCQNYAHLMGTDEVPTKADLVSDVERLFAQTQKDAQAVHDNELKQFEEDVKARIEAAKDDAEKASLQQSLDAKKQQLEDKLALDTASNDSRKAEELAKIDAKVKTAEAERDAAFKKCVDKANADGISQGLAECRIGAKTVDKYNTVCY